VAEALAVRQAPIFWLQKFQLASDCLSLINKMEGKVCNAPDALQRLVADEEFMDAVSMPM
jgi:hypothetical protein